MELKEPLVPIEPTVPKDRGLTKAPDTNFVSFGGTRAVRSAATRWLRREGGFGACFEK